MVAAVRLQPEASLLLALAWNDLVAEGEVGGVDEDFVEDVVLELGTPLGKICDSGLLQVGLRLTRDVPRVAGKGPLRIGLDDIAYEGDGWNFAEWVYDAGLEVGYEREVPQLDRLEPGEIGAVETEPFCEKLLADARGRDGKAVPPSEKVSELQVGQFDIALLDFSPEFIDRGKDCTTSLLSTRSGITACPAGRAVADFEYIS